MSDIPIIRAGIERGPAEACASFSHKINLQNYGGPAYEIVEFFASRKVECRPEDLDMLTEELHAECVAEVDGQARAYILAMRRKQAEKERRSA
jgi:hypothetical protein